MNVVPIISPAAIGRAADSLPGETPSAFGALLGAASLIPVGGVSQDKAIPVATAKAAVAQAAPVPAATTLLPGAAPKADAPIAAETAADEMSTIPIAADPPGALPAPMEAPPSESSAAPDDQVAPEPSDNAPVIAEKDGTGTNRGKVADAAIALPPSTKKPEAKSVTVEVDSKKETDKKDKEEAADPPSQPSSTMTNGQQPTTTMAPIAAPATNRQVDHPTGDKRVASPNMQHSRSPAIAATSGPDGSGSTPLSGHDNLPPLLASQTPAASARPAPMPQAMPPYPPAPPTPTPAIVAARAGTIGRDIGVEIARQVSAGRDEVLIRLDPADMGRIDVRLSFDSKGGLHASISADSPAALDLLRRDAGDLGRALTDAGIRADASSFRFDSRNSAAGQFAQQQQGQRGHGGGKPRGGSRHAIDGIGAPIGSAAPLYRQFRASGRIDMMA